MTGSGWLQLAEYIKGGYEASVGLPIDVEHYIDLVYNQWGSKKSMELVGSSARVRVIMTTHGQFSSATRGYLLL